MRRASLYLGPSGRVSWPGLFTGAKRLGVVAPVATRAGPTAQVVAPPAVEQVRLAAAEQVVVVTDAEDPVAPGPAEEAARRRERPCVSRP